MGDTKLGKESSTSSPIRKNSTGSDVSDSARELAQNALAEFNKNNFNTVASLLSKLQTTRPKDIKVLSNRAVVDYYTSGLKKTEIFQKALSEICNQANIKLCEVSSTDEVEASVMRLNRATVLFHLHQLHTAKSLLESMYKGLESLEESVSIGLCLLLAEVLLGLSLPGRAFALVACTEATFLPQPLQPQSTSTKLPGDKDTTSVVSKGSDNYLEPDGASFKRTHIMAGHETPDGDPIAGSSELRCSADQELLRSKLQTLRVRSLLQMKATKAAKKEIKSLITHANTSGYPLNLTLLMLKTQLEYECGNVDKALHMLNQCPTIPQSPVSYGPSMGVAYYNNLGLMHLNLKKPTVASIYFRKAFQELKNMNSSESKPDDTPLTQKLYTNVGDIGMQLCYNIGVTLMTLDKYAEAFEFLVEVLKSHSSNIRLWLRLGECCVGTHKKHISEDRGNTFKYRIVGSGDRRKICLESHFGSHNKKLSEMQTTPDPALPMPTLEFGRLCFQNCLSLIPKNVTLKPLSEDLEASGVIPELYACSPTCPMNPSQVIQMKLRCLANLSYVSLCLGGYTGALLYSQSLLDLISQVPKYDPALKMLGHLYAGEALSMLGRSTEAVTHFDPKRVAEIPFVDDVPLGNDPLESDLDEEQKVWSPSNRIDANKILYYNMSVTFALRKQFEKSYVLLREVLDSPTAKLPAQVIMLALYLNLQLGYNESIAPITSKGSSTAYM